MGPGCMKTPKSNFRGECLSRIPSIRKELHWPVPPNEETREHNSVRSPRVHVFTQPGGIADSGEPSARQVYGFTALVSRLVRRSSASEGGRSDPPSLLVRVSRSVTPHYAEL